MDDGLVPSIDDELTIEPDLDVQDQAYLSSDIVIDDYTLFISPSFIIHTYGQIVGPSQGLASDTYRPSRPMRLLTAVGEIPGAPYTLQESIPFDTEFPDYATPLPLPQYAVADFSLSSMHAHAPQTWYATTPVDAPVFPDSFIDSEAVETDMCDIQDDPTASQGWTGAA